jgi:hypothetical protein
MINQELSREPFFAQDQTLGKNTWSARESKGLVNSCNAFLSTSK